MKIKRFFPYLLSLFLGLNTLNAQTSQDSTRIKEFISKVHELGEVVVNQDTTENVEEIEIQEINLINSMYSGSRVTSCGSEPSVYKPANNLISSFYIQGIPTNQFYFETYFDDFLVLGDVGEQKWLDYSLSSKLDTRLFNDVNILTRDYSKKYTSLFGLIKAETRKLDNKDTKVEVSSNFLERHVFLNTSISDNYFAIYFGNKEPTYPLTLVSELDLIPVANTIQFVGQSKVFDGDLSLSLFGFSQNYDFINEFENNSINMGQGTNHLISTLSYEYPFSESRIKTTLGWEYWDHAYDIILEQADENIDLGLRHYSLTTELVSGSSNLGITLTSIRSSSLNSLLANSGFADALFNEGLALIDDNLTEEQKQALIQDYYGTPEEQRYPKLLESVNRFADLYQNVTGQDIHEIPEYGGYLDKVNTPFDDELKDHSRGIDLIKIFLDRSWDYLIDDGILFKTTLGLEKFKDSYGVSYGINFTYLKDSLEISLDYSRNASFIERNNLELAFSEDIKTRMQKSNNYSLTSLLKFDSDLLDFISAEVYFKEFKSMRDEYGKTRGITLAVEKDADFSYRFILSMGGAVKGDHPFDGSIDNLSSLFLSYKLDPSLTAFSSIIFKNGYWHNANISRDYERLPSSINLDLGLTKSFNLFNENDLQVSVGGYGLFNFITPDPLLPYLDSNGEYQILYLEYPYGSLQLTYNY